MRKNTFKKHVFTILALTILATTICFGFSGCPKSRPSFDPVVVPETPHTLFIYRVQNLGSKYSDNGFFVDTDGNVYDIQISSKKEESEKILTDREPLSKEMTDKINTARKSKKVKSNVDELKIKELLSIGQRIDFENKFKDAEISEEYHGNVTYKYYVDPKSSKIVLCSIAAPEEIKLLDQNANKFLSETYNMIEEIKNPKKEETKK